MRRLRELTTALQSHLHVLLYSYVALEPVKGILLLVEVGFIAAGAVRLRLSFSQAHDVQAWSLLGVGALGLLYSATKRLIEAIRSPRLESRIDGDRRAALAGLQPSRAEQGDGFSVLTESSIPDATALFSTPFNTFIRDNDLPVVVDHTARRPLKRFLDDHRPQLVAILRDKRRQSIAAGQAFVNEAKVCVASPIGSTVEAVTLFRGDYFSSYLTNELCQTLFRATQGRESKKFYAAADRFAYDEPAGGRRLLEFGEYPFGNHLGANTLAITRDGMLKLWRQAAVAQFSRGRLAPTGSGSCDWADAAGRTTLKHVVIAAMERECREESVRRGFDPRTPLFEETIVIGYYRDLCRGAKPGFLGLSRLAVPASALEPGADEVEETDEIPTTYPVTTADELDGVAKRLLTRGTGLEHLSVPLWLNLLALRDLLAARPDLVRRFLG